MIKTFGEDALELCEDAESALLSLEKIPDKESAGQAFRAFHNIKGNAGFLGYGDLEKISHLAENLLDRIRSGEGGCDPATMSALLKVIDAVRGKVNDVSCGGGGEIPDLAQLCESLENLAQDDQDLSRIRHSAGLFPDGRAGETERREGDARLGQTAQRASQSAPGGNCDGGPGAARRRFRSSILPGKRTGAAQNRAAPGRDPQARPGRTTGNTSNGSIARGSPPP